MVAAEVKGQVEWLQQRLKVRFECLQQAVNGQV